MKDANSSRHDSTQGGSQFGHIERRKSYYYGKYRRESFSLAILLALVALAILR